MTVVLETLTSETPSLNAVLCPVPRFRAFDLNGQPLDGGLLYAYEAGSTTPKSTYTDSTGATENANPVVLDSSGQADVWLSGDYKLVLTDSSGAQMFSVDHIDSSNGITALDTKLVGAFAQLCGPLSDRPLPDAAFGQANHGLIYFALDEHKAYRWNGTTWLDVTADLFPKPSLERSIEFVIDGNGSVPGTGQKPGRTLPVACTVTGWRIKGDAVGSAVVDILKSNYATWPTVTTMMGTSLPTLSTAQKNEATGLSIALAKGDELIPNLVSVATCKTVNVVLFITIPGA